MITVQTLVSCDRNLPWLEQVENLDVLVPLKYATHINVEVLPESTPSEFPIKYIDIGSVNSTGEVKQVGEFNFENSPSRARRKVRQGDIIVSTVRTYLKAIAYIEKNEPGLIASTGFAVLSAIQSILHPRYLYYWMRSDFVVHEICARSVGVSYPATNASEIGSIPIPILPIAQQKSIARFLDRKTAAIDTLIAKKQRLIQLLEEKRTALINQAVTKGLNPNAPMKNSSIPWIGEIPEHWEVLQIKRAFILQRGVDTTKESQTEGIVPVVSSGGVASYHNVALAKAPGVLVGRKGTIGKVHYVEQDYWSHSIALWVINFYDNYPRFVFYKLISMKLENLDTGSSNPTLNRNLVHPIETSWPSKLEQIEIANFLDVYSKKCDGIKTKIDKQIKKLQEYRRSLITAAVTGKLEISEVEADV